MPSLNKVFLIGNLTKEPELKYIPSGSAVGTLRLAVNRKYKAQDGTMKEDVLYTTVTVWGKMAENCNEFLAKGSPVFVEGRMQSRSYEGQDGIKKYVTDVVAERVQFLGGGKKKSAESGDEIPDEPLAPSAASDEDKPPF
ncbi:MAG: single-stranded DNA-binding protein [Candidatus Firestonebacteria bacterium]